MPISCVILYSRNLLGWRWKPPLTMFGLFGITSIKLCRQPEQVSAARMFPTWRNCLKSIRSGSAALWIRCFLPVWCWMYILVPQSIATSYFNCFAYFPQGLLPMQLMTQIQSNRFNSSVFAAAQELDILFHVQQSLLDIVTIRLTSYEWNAGKFLIRLFPILVAFK